MLEELSFDTPAGRLTVAARDGAIVRLRWGGEGSAQSELLARAAAQLREYFSGARRDFDLPLRVEAGAFQRAVCARMAAIPFGETVTYGEIARELGAPAQAVGQACGGNPLPVLIPCHRVLGASGLGGYSGGGGIETKVWLLRHEGAAGLLI